jgi:hypothetical protein
LKEYFDRYRSKISLSGKYSLNMRYLMLCRNTGLKPENIVFRIVRKIFGSLDYTGSGQGRIVKQA